MFKQYQNTDKFKCLCQDKYHPDESLVTDDTMTLSRTIVQYTCRVKSCPAYNVTLSPERHKEHWLKNEYGDYVK